MKCVTCSVTLTIENQAGNDEYSVYCESCWGETELWEPICSVCGEKMIQKQEDLFTILCPINNNHPKLYLWKYDK